MTLVKHDVTAQRFTAAVDGERALLEYRLADEVMTITHTEVPPAIGGRGIAAELMNAALAAAQAAKWTVVPECSYAVAHLRRRQELTDRAHQEKQLDEALDESFPASDSPSTGDSR